MAQVLVGAPMATAGALATAYSTAAPSPVGTIVKDANGGEYIMLVAGEGIAVNQFVSFDENFVALKLAANAVGGVANCLVTLTTGQWAWFMYSTPAAGVTGSCDTIAADKPCYIDATAGRVDDAVVTGDLVCGLISRTADTSNLATFQMTRPFVTDVLG